MGCRVIHKKCLSLSSKSSIAKAGHRAKNGKNLFFCPLSQCPEVGGTKDITVMVGTETRWSVV